ncbi:EF-P 5-aminopentanol modification-associated protein YfmF [Streptococcus didelphis]|uniref:EF-P 5-aminopentanol modification-associated protein YfmF n=1 Tax=Streptococcus didelphis TaxID=102886 RepID=UPI00037FE290|nr:pitrilysin family protein [Streptococcus didelphis]
MKIVDGVQLHLIETQKFKTNHMTIRFSGELNHKTVAKRVLVAQMLATANEKYPTAKRFRERLAELYGANLSTNISVKGKVHIIDIDITFIQNRYCFNGERLLDEVIQFLKEILFSPLLAIAQYQPKVFEVEKNNVINYLEADKEDSFYYSSLQLKKAFFTDESLEISKYGDADLVKKETAYTSYQEFHKMMLEDQIDIYIMGDFDEYRVVQLLHKFPFENRQKKLQYFYKQEHFNIVNESLEERPLNQSILEMAYHFSAEFGGKNHYALIVLNALLGSYAHSSLFTKVRESEGLAYTIGSRFDVFTGFLEIYAGIDKNNRTKVLQLIIKEINDLKLGRFSASLVEKTKLMLQNNMLQSEDYCKAIIDRTYINDYIDSDYSLSNWLENISKVKKTDIIKAANLLKLQSLYFLEGR